MKAKPERTAHRTSRGRVAASLCTAGVVAIALSGNLMGAGAEDTPVPGEPVGAPSSQLPPEQARDGETTPTETTTDASSTTPTQTTPAETTPPATTPSEPPAPQSSPEPAPTDTTPDQSTTPEPSTTPTPTTPTETTPAGQGPAPDPAAAPAPAPAPAPQTPASTTPLAAAPPIAPPAPLPLTGVAGPAEIPAPSARDCSATKPATASSKARLELQGGGAAGTAQAPKDCAPKSHRTLSPERAAQLDRAPKPALRNAQGVPTVANPTMSLALPGPVPVGVPNFFIDKFRIPPFLLPIYQAAGIEYGVRWEVLAAINEIETDYGRNLNISSAGALGWMQFMPATWKQYGVDANRDGRKDPFNPVDAIFAAARYLKAAGADHDLRRAIFAYNHADWYVESVLMRARLVGGLPDDLVGSLNGLTQGHFPVFAKARYADDLAEHALVRRTAQRHNVADPVESDATRRGIDIFAKAGSPVIAVQDGTIVGLGRTKRLGNYVQLRDVYGNTYTYARLKRLARHVPVPKPGKQSRASIARELALPKRDPAPTRSATAGRPTHRSALGAAGRPTIDELASGAAAALDKERLFAHPGRPNTFPHGGERQIAEAELELGSDASLRSYITGVYGLGPDEVVLKRLAVGRRVIAGTILGRIGQTDEKISPRLHFEIRPAGRGAPRIDPKPILDGWKLLESTAIYRVQGRNALLGDAGRASIGQIMLMSKEALTRSVLTNPRIELYSCGRRDIEAGIVDRRVLATLEFLASSGLKPTVTSLTCGHGYYTSSGRVSAHSSGNAVDIAKINGIPILGHQGVGSVTDITIRRLLTLQGTLKPNQIISLMTYDGADNTLALADHADHIHVGFPPAFAPGTPETSRIEAVLKPAQWLKLIDRLGRIDNPSVAAEPSKYAIRVPVQRASTSHRGE